MTLKPDAELTPTVAHDVCERTASQAVLRGTVAQTGSSFLLTAELIGCADGATIAIFREEAQDREALPHAVDKLAASLRHGLGESRRTIARFSQPLFPAQGRTNSMEALEAYSQAVVLSQSGRFPEAMELLKHALALDPEFAAGWLDLSSFAANANDRAAMIEYLKKAYAVRSQGTAPVRYLIEARYASEVQGDLLGAEQSYKAILALYPRNATALSSLGETQRQIGHHADAAETLSRALLLAPNYAALYYGVCTEKAKAGLLDEAKQACDSGIAHGLDSEIIRLGLLKLAITKHDRQLYAQQAAWAEQHRSPLLIATEAEGDLMEGRVRDALAHVAQACALLEPMQDAVCGEYRFGIAAELAQMGEMDRAKKLVAHRTPDPTDLNGLATLAELGDRKAAEAGLKAYQIQHPVSPSWDAKVGALVRADILLADHRPSEAIAALEPARAYEDFSLDSWHLRALAYQQNGQPDKAAAEFQRLLKAQSIDSANVDIPLAQLGLGRALAAAHRSDEARQAYKDFLSMWSQADADLVLPAAARKELAGLDAP
jgi:tetratricopeptide (TPR) repeat protein